MFQDPFGFIFSGMETDSRVLNEDILSCALCTEIFCKPVLLSCGHSICLKCAESLLNFVKSKNHSATVGCSPVRSNAPVDEKQEDEIGCPNCSKKTIIPRDKEITQLLKPNFNLRDIIDNFQRGNYNCIEHVQNAIISKNTIVSLLLAAKSKKCENDCDKDATVECAGCNSAAYCEGVLDFCPCKRSV